MTIRMAIVGLGKIARDQHVPAIAATPGLELVATVSPDAPLPGVPHFAKLSDLLAGAVPIDAVAICTPPQSRGAQARLALKAGKHVLLEKPPGATVSELAPLVTISQLERLTLFTAWHSRFAPAVEPARAFLARHPVRSVTVEWREDVRIWHPRQAWLWQPGGLGAFDPGINALSILTRILPRPLFLTAAGLTYPANCATPIAVDLNLTDTTGLPIRATFDFRQTGPQIWEIRAETEAGGLTLSNGGSRLECDGRTQVEMKAAEYPSLYLHFVSLIASRASDVDLSPLELVADAFMLGSRRTVEPFVEDDWA